MDDYQMYFRLDGHTPVPTDDIRKAFDRSKKRVAQTTLPDGTWISTVFLGLNHQFGDGPPLLFETMVFPSKDNFDEKDMERCCTWEEAEAQHRAMVERWSNPRNSSQSDDHSKE